jgi:hypothetical protein
LVVVLEAAVPVIPPPLSAGTIPRLKQNTKLSHNHFSIKKENKQKKEILCE